MAKFRAGNPPLLVATDVAARGLDTHVEAVLNIDMPMSVKGCEVAGALWPFLILVFPEYVHRVGRTARAGRSGLAISLVKEQDRSLVKVGNHDECCFFFNTAFRRL